MFKPQKVLEHDADDFYFVSDDTVVDVLCDEECRLFNFRQVFRVCVQGRNIVSEYFQHPCTEKTLRMIHTVLIICYDFNVKSFEQAYRVDQEEDDDSEHGDYSEDDYDYFVDYDQEDYEAPSSIIYIIETVVGLVIFGVLICCISQECLLKQFQQLLDNNFPNIKRPQSRTIHLQ